MLVNKAVPFPLILYNKESPIFELPDDTPEGFHSVVEFTDGGIKHN